MIPTKRVAKVLGCMLVMGFGAELQAGKFADLWANLSNRLRFLSRARDAMPTGEGFRNWFDDNVYAPKDEERAEASFERRYVKLRTKLHGLESSACNMAAIASGRKKAAKLKKEIDDFFSSRSRTNLLVTDSSGAQHSVCYENLRMYNSSSDRYMIINSYVPDLELFMNSSYGDPDTLPKYKFKDDQKEAFEKSWKEYKFLSRSRYLDKDYCENFLKANMEWNDGKITRFLPATYEQRYGTLATAMLMRWISTGEHPGQQVKKLAKVPGRLLSRARGMITRNPSE